MEQEQRTPFTLRTRFSVQFITCQEGKSARIGGTLTRLSTEDLTTCVGPMHSGVDRATVSGTHWMVRLLMRTTSAVHIPVVHQCFSRMAPFACTLTATPKRQA